MDISPSPFADGAARRLLGAVEELDAFLAGDENRISTVALLNASHEFGMLLVDVGVISYAAAVSPPVTEPVVELWTHLATSRVHPGVAAAAWRNLWRCKVGTSLFGSATEAIKMFEENAADPTGSASDRAEALSEAVEVAAEIGNTNGDLERLVPLAFEMLQAELEEAATTDLASDAGADSDVRDHHRAALTLAKTLAILAQSGGRRTGSQVDRTRLEGAVDQLNRACALDAMLHRRAADIRIGLHSDTAERRRSAVAAYIRIERARPEDDEMRRYAQLREWERMAQDAGDSELADELQAELQGIDVRSHLTTIRSEMVLPEQLSRAFSATVDQICEPDDLYSQLYLSVMHPSAVWRTTTLEASSSTSGDDRNQEQRPSNGLHDALPSITIGNENTVRRTTAPGERDRETEQVQAHWMYVQLELDAVVRPALRRAFDAATPDDVVATIERIASESGLLDPITSRSCASAVLDFVQGRTDAAAHTLAPRVERAVRTAAKLRQISVITTARPGRPGTHDTFGSVLAGLTGRVVDDARQHLLWVLTHDAGPNLRNQIAHGDIPAADERTAALALHSLLLVLFVFAHPTDAATTAT